MYLSTGVLGVETQLAGKAARYHSARKSSVDVLQHVRVGGSSLTKCPLLLSEGHGREEGRRA